MKRINVDMNFNYFGPDKPALVQMQIDHFRLSEGDRVVVYQEEEEWTGVVGRDDSAPENYVWYVHLEGESVTVDSQRLEDRGDGEENGRYVGLSMATTAIAYRMLEDSVDLTLVGKYTKLPESQLAIMQDQVNRRKSKG